MEIEVNLNGKPCKVEMEALTFGTRNNALRKATTVDLMTQQASIDTIEFGEWRLVYTIKSMDIVGWKQANTEQAKMNLIRGLPLKAGDALSRAEQKLNSDISGDDKKKS